MISASAVNIKGVEITPLDFFVTYMSKMSEEPLLVGIPHEGAMRVEVKGKKEGKPAKVIYMAKARMNEGTGVPVAVGAHMLAAGSIKEKGVFAPEGCIDPVFFIKEMVKRGFSGQEIIETASITEFGQIAL